MPDPNSERVAKVAGMFAEAHGLYAEAVNYLDEADKLWNRELLRKSAGKTWAAALLATNALILARTGVAMPPDDENATYNCLMHLVWDDRNQNQDLRPVKGRYATISGDIYETAVCEGNVEPPYLLIHDIRETKGYIERAQRLAGVQDDT